MPPVENPAKKRKVDTAPRQSSRSRQPSTRALQHLYEEAADSDPDDEMDLLGHDAGLDDDDDSNDELEDDDSEELQDGLEDEVVEGGNGSEDETAVDSCSEEPAPVVPSKRMRGPGKGAYLLPLTYLLIDTRVAKATAQAKPSSRFYTLILSMFSSQEITKAVSKRTPVSASLEFLSDDPWSTLCDQMLVKISAALNPHLLIIENYTVNVVSTRVISKPGLPLNSEDDYALVLKHLSKAKGDNVILTATICEKPQPGLDSEANKENEEAEKLKSKSKKVPNIQFVRI
jgi:hypothetical protein